MSDYVLETKGLGISFGGLKAVSDVNLKIKKGDAKERNNIDTYNAQFQI